MAKRPIERGDLISTTEGGVRIPAAGGRCGDGEGRGKGRRSGRGAASEAGRPQMPDDGVVRVGRERRRGKGVTVVSGVPLSGKDLEQLAKALKQRCGSGGTLRDGVIEIQGDHRDALLTALQAHGWTVKRVGG